ncbi:MAG: hypothetical protein RLZZ546_725, partial [Bacteroidota bacterium]
MFKTLILVTIIGIYSFYVYLGSTPDVKVYRACSPISTVSSLAMNITSRWDYDITDKLNQVSYA